MTPTPTPIEHDADLRGGGDPNDAALATTSTQNPPVSETAQPLQVTPFTQTFEALASALPVLPLEDDLDSAELERRWAGELTRASMRRLKDAVRTGRFDEEKARQVLALVWEGMTLTKACKTLQMSRGTIRAWGRLIPDFGALLDQAEKDLGGYYRDMAADEVEDPAMKRAHLAVASSYDRSIAKGDGDVNVAQGITVTVQRFGD